jgi:hypothetical protein
MLIEFTVGNYRSIREPQTLSMVANKVVSKDKRLDEENVFDVDGIRLLKTAAIYGANSSGKSNFIKAISFMRRLTRRFRLRREAEVNERIDVEPFLLDAASPSQPSHFEAVFFARGKQYRYGFDATQDQIVSEWLYHVPEQRETLLFHREGNQFELKGNFRKEGDGLQERTRENRLFLPVVAEFNGQIASDVIEWFNALRIDSGVRDIPRAFTSERILDSSQPMTSRRELLLDLLRRLNLGFDDVAVERERIEIDENRYSDFASRLGSHLSETEQRVPSDESTRRTRYVERARTKTVHRLNESSEQIRFDLNSQESDGTQRVFALAGETVDVLSRGHVMIVDEMDARLHPILTRNLVQMFNSNQSNPKNAQLVFATHDTNLLTNKLFRRDQIWFVEKDQNQASQLYSLAEFKGVRNDASFEKDYILGRYGAIPFLGDLRDMISVPPDGSTTNAASQTSETDTNE